MIQQTLYNIKKSNKLFFNLTNACFHYDTIKIGIRYDSIFEGVKIMNKNELMAWRSILYKRLILGNKTPNTLMRIL